jgi:hypothetical protein
MTRVHRLLRSAKRAAVPKGVAPRRIKFGPARGIVMNIDLQHQTQLLLGLYERELHSALTTHMRFVSCALDLGSHDGYYTLIFQTFPNVRKILAVEAEPSQISRLRSNLTINHLLDDSRIAIHQTFVGDTDSPNSTTIDTLIDDLDGPYFVKMDVEGAELSVLRGAQHLLQRRNSAWLLETHSEALEQDCERFFQQFQYRTRIIPNAKYRTLIPEQRSPIHNRWLLAIPPHWPQSPE